MPKESLEELAFPEYWDRRYLKEQEEQRGKVKGKVKGKNGGADEDGGGEGQGDGNGDGQGEGEGEEEVVLGSFEWFKSYEKLKGFFDKYLPSPGSGSGCCILHLGCGNSVSFFLCLIISFFLSGFFRVSSLVFFVVDSKYGVLVFGFVGL